MHGWQLVPLTASFAFISPANLAIAIPVLALIPVGLILLGRMAAGFRRVPIAQIADTIHPYPTFALGNRQAADGWYRRKLKFPLLRVFGKVLGYRGEPGASIYVDEEADHAEQQ